MKWARAREGRAHRHESPWRHAELLWLAALGLTFCAGCSKDVAREVCETGDCSDTPSGTTAPTTGGLPFDTPSCDLHGFAGAPTGICIPHVDAGWHTALVRKVPKEETPTCPRSAQWAGFLGEEIAREGATPLQIIGCSVNPLATCSDYSWACVPFEADY